MCQPMATRSICDAAVPNSRAIHICMKGRSRVSSEKLGATESERIVSRIVESMYALHEDDHLLVLEKPAGLLCVPGRGEDKQDCLSARAQAQWPDALIVHRLDMATSGLVVMARGAAM